MICMMTSIHESLLEARERGKKTNIYIASLIVKHSKDEKTKKEERKRESFRFAL